jgi:hypothetical protein
MYVVEGGKVKGTNGEHDIYIYISICSMHLRTLGSCSGFVLCAFVLCVRALRSCSAFVLCVRAGCVGGVLVCWLVCRCVGVHDDA